MRTAPARRACAARLRSRTYKVVLGEYDLTVEEGPEQHIPIKPEDIFVNPGWKPGCVSCGSDIALLKLSHRPVLNDKVSLACLPPPDVVLPNEYPCYITGWGRISTGGPLPAKLQQASLPVVDYEHCSKPNWWGGSVRQSMICAGGDIRSGCNGDSGGPLNCQGVAGRWYVHGITSFVSALGCNTLKKPTVFTRVSAFNEWIQKVSCCLRPCPPLPLASRNVLMASRGPHQPCSALQLQISVFALPDCL
ncbi:chymotrypsin-like elastase family member 3B [Crotalus adamanteus]|uniref:Chymotrypsin-like elastase family member 3B n=1 Tax=Crotalus adamanteus TaxID=8729 RepID=A0AAW1ARC2_CROAD